MLGQRTPKSASCQRSSAPPDCSGSRKSRRGVPHSPSENWRSIQSQQAARWPSRSSSAGRLCSYICPKGGDRTRADALCLLTFPLVCRPPAGVSTYNAVRTVQNNRKLPRIVRRFLRSSKDQASTQCRCSLAAKAAAARTRSARREIDAGHFTIRGRLEVDRAAYPRCCKARSRACTARRHRVRRQSGAWAGSPSPARGILGEVAILHGVAACRITRSSSQALSQRNAKRGGS